MNLSRPARWTLGLDGDRVEMLPVTPARKFATTVGLLGLLAVAASRRDTQRRT